MRKLIILGVIIVVVIFAVLFIFKPAAPKKDSNTTPSPEVTTSTSQVTLEQLAAELELKPTFSDYNYRDWLEGNDNARPLKGKEFIVTTTDLNNAGIYRKLSDDNLNDINEKNLSQLTTATDAFFTSNGFSKNAMNTRTVVTDSMKVHYYGYEKGPEKCVIRIDELSNPFGSFVCGTIDANQEALQKDFRSLFFSPAVVKNTPADQRITTFRVQKIDGNYAIGSANSTIWGFTWMAKKVNNAWQIVWQGNEIATCTDMEKNGIPKSIYQNCYSGS